MRSTFTRNTETATLAKHAMTSTKADPCNLQSATYVVLTRLRQGPRRQQPRQLIYGDTPTSTRDASKHDRATTDLNPPPLPQTCLRHSAPGMLLCLGVLCHPPCCQHESLYRRLPRQRHKTFPGLAQAEQVPPCSLRPPRLQDAAGFSPSGENHPYRQTHALLRWQALLGMAICRLGDTTAMFCARARAALHASHPTNYNYDNDTTLLLLCDAVLMSATPWGDAKAPPAGGICSSWHGSCNCYMVLCYCVTFMDPSA